MSPWELPSVGTPVSGRARRGLRVSGIVQGVGFRPYVYSLATDLGLTGHVGNDVSGVFIAVEGSLDDVEEFIRRLPLAPPRLARIDSVTVADQPPQGDASFAIADSDASATGDRGLVPPDTAVCSACMTEVLDPADRRYRYPFTTCTHCGPRYTLITGLPYDRPFTTMAAFPLCPECDREYRDPGNRRFHAQPTACPTCGPALRFRRLTEVATPSGDAALLAALRSLAAGEIVAIKGVGGYHLVCDAEQVDAIARLRTRKQRGGKPFAVMALNLEAARLLADVDDGAWSLVSSPAAPIVLCPQRHDDGALIGSIRGVAPGMGTVGIMRPYSPLHQLLFEPHPGDLGLVPPRLLVMTSGNVSDEPLCIDENEAEERLSDIADCFLHHDRPIHVACDDSVVRRAHGHATPLRRSRGFAPLPVALPVDSPPVLAVGGELKATVCLASGRHAHLSQHIGDVENLETLAMLERTVTTLGELTRISPELVVADLHPRYLSRTWAQGWAARNDVPLMLVQHHHAHLASLLAEHGVPADEPVLGIICDGTGWAEDGTIWGGELLLGSYASVRRVGHLSSVSLPGGDASVHRPLRAALAALTAAGLPWGDDIASVASLAPGEGAAIASMLGSGYGCTPTTSMGRLFDIVASLIGVRQEVEFEGQAAMELEALAEASDVAAALDFGLTWEGDDLVLDSGSLVRSCVAALRRGEPRPRIAAGFHDALAEGLTLAACALRDRHSIETVGLSGGVFQNAYLSDRLQGRLVASGFRVLVHDTVPPNDGGLALGQAAVAACGGAASVVGSTVRSD